MVSSICNLTSKDNTAMNASSLDSHCSQNVEIVKTLIYKGVREQIDRVNTRIESTNKDLLLDSIESELVTYEDALASKALKALNTMNTKLQKEITNFINLKMRIAFHKSGISQAIDSNIIDSSEEFFQSIEDDLLLKLDDIQLNYQKIHKKGGYQKNGPA